MDLFIILCTVLIGVLYIGKLLLRKLLVMIEKQEEAINSEDR